jgi:hypothetical protein
MKIAAKTLTLRILEAVSFIVAGLAFFTLVSSLGNWIGSSVDVKSLMAPYWLSVVLLIYFVFAFHLVLFPESERKLALTRKVNGVILAAFSFVAALLIIVYVATGRYGGIVEGLVTPLFPLDFLISDLLLCAIGVYWAIRGSKGKVSPEVRYYPYRYGKARKVVSSVFRGLWTLFALYFTAGFLLFIFIANYGSPSWWSGLFMWILMGVPSGLLVYREFFYRDEVHTAAGDVRRSAVCLMAACLATLLFLVALLVNRNFIVEDATGLFFLDFTKSWNAAPYFMSLTALLPPLVAFIDSLIKAKKGKEKSPQSVEKNS